MAPASNGTFPGIVLAAIGGRAVISATGLPLAWGSGFKVQICTNLTSGAWSDVPGGNVSPVNITATQPASFYRLTQQ